MYYSLIFDLLSSSADIICFENKEKHKMPKGKDVQYLVVISMWKCPWNEIFCIFWLIVVFKN